MLAAARDHFLFHELFLYSKLQLPRVLHKQIQQRMFRENSVFHFYNKFQTTTKQKMTPWRFHSLTFLSFAEDGRLKYKVSFEEKGKSLVSGHHIAFDTTPKLEQLYVGARVVVRCQDNKFRFRPAVLAELPSRKNRLRCVFE